MFVLFKYLKNTGLHLFSFEELPPLFGNPKPKGKRLWN